MMSYIAYLKNKVMGGDECNKEEALHLHKQPLEELCMAANEIRKYFCENYFDLCTIINGKSGSCSENCKFCAQSAHYQGNVETYGLLSTDSIIEDAKYNYEQGVLRYSIVTSGKRLTQTEVDEVCKTLKELDTRVDIALCISFGLLDEKQYQKLKVAGVSRVHNNLETSRRYFPMICSTHSFDDKIKAIQAAQKAGLQVCSGGIMGLGETWEDRIDMALTLRKLGIKSIPINMLNPIIGTPFEHREVLSNDTMRRIVAVYRFLLPSASIRLAGGRGLCEDKGASCFLSGANAAITGDMLTTAGITVETDMKLLKELGYEARLCNE